MQVLKATRSRIISSGQLQLTNECSDSYSEVVQLELSKHFNKLKKGLRRSYRDYKLKRDFADTHTPCFIVNESLPHKYVEALYESFTTCLDGSVKSRISKVSVSLEKVFSFLMGDDNSSTETMRKNAAEFNLIIDEEELSKYFKSNIKSNIKSDIKSDKLKESADDKRRPSNSSNSVKKVSSKKVSSKKVSSNNEFFNEWTAFKKEHPQVDYMQWLEYKQSCTKHTISQ